MKISALIITLLLAAAAFSAGYYFGHRKDGTRKSVRAATTSERDELIKWRPWNGSFLPDTTASVRTKLGKLVQWRSMGNPRATHPQNGVANKKFGRYPRYFECTLENVNGGQMEFDLYDIGAQRDKENLYLKVDTANTTVTGIAFSGASSDADNIYDIPKAEYNHDTDANGGDRPTYPVRLTISGPPGSKCVLLIYREIHKPNEGEGSPPPADPGNGHNEEN